MATEDSDTASKNHSSHCSMGMPPLWPAAGPVCPIPSHSPVFLLPTQVHLFQGNFFIPGSKSWKGTRAQPTRFCLLHHITLPEGCDFLQLRKPL